MFQYTPGQWTCERVPNTALIGTAAVISALVTTLGRFQVEKVFLSNIWTLKRPFVNIFTPDETYFPGNRENLLQTIEMSWSKNLKIFSHLFPAFLKSKFNFKHVEQKDVSHSLCFLKIIDSEIRPDVTV